ncbi:aspartate aminotransferase family protein [Motiliproteus sp. SC1-56]|uniref:aspartate aminotransferase family protein n=1 Tax=Motiliproteus sp. SC1-56 TaxID=2799565 RepID=UPI001A8D3412|nr:aspartate aminotransferase family protein [Motiliproteus sp. SC1-56]
MTQQKLFKSARLYQRALNVMPGGCSRNTVLRKPHPLYAERGEGCYVTDIEGTRRIDFANNMASLIHGHAHPEVVARVTEQVQKGTAFTLATEQEIEYAEHLCSRNPGFDKIRFVNSGTEAVMSCLKAARAFTGRPKIAKVEGAYHGLYDYAEVSQTAKPSNWGDIDRPASVPVAHGTPATALNDVVVIPFNDPERAIAILDQHADELACVLVDLLPHRVGLIPATNAFVQALRKWTRDNGALLVCDEVITFRSTYGGAQEWYDVCPDLTAMGKMIGGGYPVGALAGRRDVMDVMDPLADKVLFPHSGTFSANPITMTAGLASMQLFTEQAVEQLNQLSDYARDVIAEAIRVADVPACVTGDGSIFRVHMKPQAPSTYRETFPTEQESGHTKVLLDHLFDNGIMMINTCSGTLSTAMTRHEIDVLGEVMLSGFRKIKQHRAA